MTADAECGIVDRMDHEHDAVPEVDYRATSVRTPWAQLPEPVRAAVQQVCGCPVLAADPPVTSGFSGGSASVLHLADGRRVFAKAGYGANEHLLSAYRKEAEVLAVLPPTVPAPRPVGSAQMAAGLAGEHPWQIVVSQAVSGRMPMPWTEASLDAVHTACVAATTALTPPPAGLGGLVSMVEDYARDPDIVTALPALAAGELELVAGQPAWLRGRLADLQALVELGEVALVGNTACHCDLRADNILITPSEGGHRGPDSRERAVFVDWNFLAVGPAWTDFVGLLPPARQDGVDVDAWVARSPLTAGVPADHLDAWLALMAAYMLAYAPRPLWPGGTPAIRVHQARYARMFLDWLADRRGWA